MTNELNFISDDQYKTHLADIDFWQSKIVDVLRRHSLASDSTNIIAGFNATYPVFLTGDVVVKFFGHRPNWQETFINECAAHDCLVANKAIRAPKIIAKGSLFENAQTPWSYTISTRMLGRTCANIAHFDLNSVR